MNTNMQMHSAHRDVLQAPIPDSPDKQRSLLEELKTRGRSAVGGKAWMDAQMLYDKALKVAGETTPNNERAILHSNLSLVLGKMGNFLGARDSAAQATQVDATYVKGWWRLAQAQSSLKKYPAALEAMTKALELDPNNKALKKEFDKLEQEAADYTPPEEKPEVVKKEPAPPRSEIYNKPPKTKDVEMKDATASVEKMNVDDEDKNLFSKSDKIRGYKIVNGKKTSYFHNELSDEARELIGDIAPKKLETAQVQPTAGDSNKSAWNQAGTWEERDVTAWAKDSLKEALQSASYQFPDSSPAPGAVAKITTVKKLDGNASFATVRNKKKYIYEFHLALEWALDVPSQQNAAKGKMTFPDVDGTCELGEGYEATFEITTLEDQSLRPVIDRFVFRQGLRDLLHQTIDDWVRAFREKY